MLELEKLQHQNKIVGIKQSIKALNQDKVETLFIAQDADARLIQQVQEIAKAKNIEIIVVDTMKKLGNACGIDVSAAVAATLKE